MANQTTQSFGITSGSGGGGGGGGTVTSVGMTVPAALSVAGSPITGAGTLEVTGAGTTEQYIDGTGALQTTGNVNGLVSTFDGATAPSATTAGTGGVPIYDVQTFPNGTFSMVQNGRAFFGLANAVGAQQRIGLGGVSTFDQVVFTVTVQTNCNSGVLVVATAGNGIMAGRVAVSINFTCTGAVQTQTLSDTFRVGDNGVAPSSPTTDWFGSTFATSASSGTVEYTNLDFTITQYSA